MQKIISLTFTLLLGLSLLSCGEKKPLGLEGKKAQLENKKAALLKLNQEISALEKEIAELDPTVKEQIRVTPGKYLYAQKSLL